MSDAAAGGTAAPVRAAACRIGRLRLYQFRNYADETVECGPGLNVFAGRNAQGKTNLLEAAATLTLTRSPRAGSSADLLRWGASECQVEAHVERPPAPTDLAVRFRLDADTHRVSRATSVDGKPRPARSLLGVCPVVLFWPDDLLLVKGGPEGRRRLLDVVLSQLDPRMAVALLRYRRVLDQRNAVLKQLREGAGSIGLLDSFDAEFAELGAAVRAARADLTSRLAVPAAAALTSVGGLGEQLGLAYTAGGRAVDGGVESVDNLRDALRERLRGSRAEEIARGSSADGPHRDDVEILLGGRPARTAASQGQQRSIVLALKLAEVEHLRAVTGAAPVLILDDVLSELDERRRGALLGAVADADLQTLVTTAEPGALALREGAGPAARFFEVEAGRVRPLP